MTERVIQCWSCAGSYTMSELEDDKVRFKPRQLRVACPEKDCGGESYVWERNLERGNSWICHDCGSVLTFALGVMVTRSDEVLEKKSPLPYGSGLSISFDDEGRCKHPRTPKPCIW